MDNEKKKYIYEGPVYCFDKLISEKYRAETLAVSKAKAKSNIIYAYKKSHGLTPDSKIDLKGEIKLAKEA